MNRYKTIVIAVIAAVVLWIAPAAVLAVDITTPACQGISDSTVCKEATQGQTTNPLFGEQGVLTSVINILSLVLGIIAVIVLMVAGIRFALSQGDGQKVASVRGTIIYACVGIAVAALAQALVQLVLSKL